MNSWKEQFKLWFIKPGDTRNYGVDEYGEYMKANPERVQDFISTEIIEKLIADIPGNTGEGYFLKQQLRDKYL
jgi:hypothetical protein